MESSSPVFRLRKSSTTSGKKKATRYDCDLMDKLMSFDAFGENFNMKLDQQNSILKTYVGSILTILAYSIVFMYTYLKSDTFINKKDVDIMSTVMIDHLPNDYIVSHDIGLNLAIAFTDYDTNPELILDKSYGEIVFSAHEWGVNDEGDYF